MKQRFANNLRTCRIKAGLSQVNLAKKLGYTGKAISKWESGRALPPSELLPRLAYALGTDLNTLFKYNGDPVYFLGVDGGGTKTRFLLQNNIGETITDLTLEACNPSGVGITKCIEILKQGFHTVCDGICYDEISVFCGIAGAGVSDIRKQLEKEFATFGFYSLKIDSDISNIVSIGLRGTSGVVAIVGTGSVVFAVSDKKQYQIAGYGHLIGDVLSGSELGRLALNVAFSDLDNSGEDTLITKKVIQMIGEDPKQALADIYEKGKSYIASFACCLLDSAREGDIVAKRLLQDNIEKFDKQIDAALRHCPVGAPVVVAGGIICNYPEISKSMTHKIKILNTDPVYGAVALAGGKVNE